MEWELHVLEKVFGNAMDINSNNRLKPKEKT